jgi:hypothetical protein
MMLTLLPDINIAPLKYAHVQKKHGGPVASVTYRERDLPSGKMFEGFAMLDEKSTGFQAPSFLYANAHGTGFAATKAEAIYCAISEAMERWAWQASSRDPALREAVRLDLNPTNSGFAAFPGLGLQGVKKRAFFEAAELWSVGTWWEGRLPHKELRLDGASGIAIQSPIPGVAIVLLWREANGLAYFGSAASHTQASAIESARLEMQHHQDVLEFSKITTGAEADISVKRMQFFSRLKGLASFRERLTRQGSRDPAPSLLVDASVRGPWTQYAHVWRCLFDSSGLHEKDREDYFLL